MNKLHPNQMTPMYQGLFVELHSHNCFYTQINDGFYNNHKLHDFFLIMTDHEASAPKVYITESRVSTACDPWSYSLIYTTTTFAFLDTGHGRSNRIKRHRTMTISTVKIVHNDHNQHFLPLPAHNLHKFGIVLYSFITTPQSYNPADLTR